MDKRKLYSADFISDFRDLVKRYEKFDKIAFKFREKPKGEIITKTYSDFVNDIKSLGTALLSNGLEKKRIAIIAPNRYEWCVSYLAITTSNMIVVPLDKALPDNEIENLIIRSKSDAVIYDKQYTNVFENLKKNPECNLTHYICMDNTEYTCLLSKGNELLKNDDNSYEKIHLNNKEMSIMLFTSGTTSISKAVALSQYNICSDIYALAQMTDITEKDSFLSFLPLHHTFESTCTFLYGSYCGITICFCDGLKYVVDNLKEYEITGFVSVPLMLEIMYKKIQKEIENQHKTGLIKFARVLSHILLSIGIDVRRKLFAQILEQLGGKLRIIVSGGAAMNVNAIKGYLDFGINLLQGYGLTETSPVISGENDKYKRAGSVGFPLPGIDVSIFEPDKDGIGEIIVKSPTVMLGYYDNDVATKETIIDGWLHTGDLGYIDKDGFIFITGRKKDVIVLKNGKNVFPEELEMLINELPYVSESMVFGKTINTKNDRNEDIILCAKIVYDENVIKNIFPDEISDNYFNLIWKDIKDKINKTMPAYKYIREIIITKTPLIKTTTQKIKRHEELKRINRNFLKLVLILSFIIVFLVKLCAIVEKSNFHTIGR